MNKRRLIRLAALLEKDAKNKTGVKFDLDRWGETEKAKKFVKADCGTTACAVGLACVSGAFKKDGLTFELDDKGFIYPKMSNPNWDGIIYSQSVLSGEDAVNELFGLTKQETRFLFFSQHYPEKETKGAVGELAVARRIRDFVAGKVAP